jgi:hypothetical protein
MLGAHRWEFVGKPPMIFTVVAILLFANVFVSLALFYLAKRLIPSNLPNSQVCSAMANYGIQYGVPGWLCWYVNWDMTISGTLLALVILIMIILREDVRRVR